MRQLYVRTAVLAMGNIFKMADEDEERQRFSPDSSTQVLNKEKHKHRKKKKHKHRSKKRKRKHSEERTSDHDDNQHSGSSNNSSAESGDDERSEAKQKREFVIDIKPLTEYIDDRKKLNNELFKILERKQMKKLMPKSVKKLDVGELKSRCLDQLEIMSKKRLLRIIEGQEMNSSSSESGHDIANVVSAMEVVQESSVAEASQTEPDSRQNESVNIMEELSVGPDQEEIDALVEEPVKNPAPEDVIPEPDSLGKAAGSPENKSAVDNPEDKSAVDSPEDKSAVDTESQLLELEFRARALKSLMQARQRHDA